MIIFQSTTPNQKYFLFVWFQFFIIFLSFLFSISTNKQTNSFLFIHFQNTKNQESNTTNNSINKQFLSFLFQKSKNQKFKLKRKISFFFQIKIKQQSFIYKTNHTTFHYHLFSKTIKSIKFNSPSKNSIFTKSHSTQFKQTNSKSFPTTKVFLFVFVFDFQFFIIFHSFLFSNSKNN